MKRKLPPSVPLHIQERIFWVIMIAGILIVTGTIFFSCQPVHKLNESLGLKDDNPFEEVAEYGLKVGLDVDADLTADSPE